MRQVGTSEEGAAYGKLTIHAEEIKVPAPSVSMQGEGDDRRDTMREDQNWEERRGEEKGAGKEKEQRRRRRRRRLKPPQDPTQDKISISMKGIKLAAKDSFLQGEYMSIAGEGGSEREVQEGRATLTSSSRGRPPSARKW
eukprot:756776-Hanusia_phi.AAC.2